VQHPKLPHARCPRQNNFGGTALRVLTAIPILIVAAVMIWAPPFNQGFFLLVAAMAGLAAWEFHQLCAAKKLGTHAVVSVIASILVCLAAWYGHLAGMMAAAFGGVVVLAFLHIVKGSHSISGLSASVFGLLYTGLLPAHFVLLHQIPEYGPGLVTLLIAAVGLSDTGAYFTGRAIGRNKLAPRVSPNKTWEGSVGGVVWAVAALVIWALVAAQFNWTFTPPWPLWYFAVVGALLAVISQIGDLVESLIKRDAGVKDSGAIFPGHGGALDRCDGFLFAGPALCYLLLMI